MATTIPWVVSPDGGLGETLNPLTGCRPISPGCAHMEGTPEGTQIAYLYNGEVIILGTPPDEEEGKEPAHNCDAMGCSSFGHVVQRFSLDVVRERDEAREALAALLDAAPHVDYLREAVARARRVLGGGK